MLSNLLGFDLRKEQRLTVTYAHGEQTSWVGLPPSFSTRLLENLPVVLKVQLYAAHAVPVGTPCYLSWSGTVSESGTISVSSQLGHLLPLPEGRDVVMLAMQQFYLDHALVAACLRHTDRVHAGFLNPEDRRYGIGAPAGGRAGGGGREGCARASVPVPAS